MPFIINANWETRKRDRKTTSFICLVLSYSKQPVGNTGGQVTANSHICMVLHCFVLYYFIAEQRLEVAESTLCVLSHIISF